MAGRRGGARHPRARRATRVRASQVHAPSITIIRATANARVGYDEVTSAFGPGFPGTLQVLVPTREQRAALEVAGRTDGVATVLRGATSHGWTLDQVVPTTGPSTAATGATIERLRQELLSGSLDGEAAAENFDLQQALASRTPVVLEAARMCVLKGE